MELPTNLREKWVQEISSRLAHDELVRLNFEGQLNRFFDMLQVALESGDPSWLNPLLDEWGETRTETEIERRESHLSALLNQILLIMYETSREILDFRQTLELLDRILPFFTHAFEYAVNKETLIHLTNASEEMNQAQAALERLNKSKSDFISVAAHELRTPLTLIEGFTAMLRELLGKDHLDEQAVVMFDGIDKGTRRMRDIIEDMVDVSLIDNNLLTLTYQPVWLNRILGMVTGELQSKADLRNQTLEVVEFPGSHEMIYGDNERLYQAFRNIILNAIKFTPDGGRIVINGRKLPGFLEVVIADSGIGIDQNNYDQIFDKFNRLGNTAFHTSSKTEYKGGGPGLGLSIAKGIIEAHGGTIWVESEGYNEEYNLGSKFHIILQVHMEPPDDRNAKLYKHLSEIDRLS